MVSSIIKNGVHRYASIQTGTLAGNGDHEIDLSGVIAGNPKAIVLEGYVPSTTWNTTLIVKQTPPTTKKMAVRTIGSNAQVYTLFVCAFY